MKKVILLLIITCLLFSCSNKNENNIDIERTAIIFEICEGENLSIQRDGLKENGYEGMRLIENDILSTDDETSVYIRVDDDKNILLGYSTTMQVTKLKSGKLSLTLLAGEFFFDVTSTLKEDETMEFCMSNASMSIRGTSGAGRIDDEEGAVFSIYTGLGILSESKDDDVSETNTEEYPIAPGTKAIVSNQIGSTASFNVQLEFVQPDDVPEVMQEYVKDNEDYQEKLQDKNWQVDDNGNITGPSVEPIISKENEETIKYVGWRQNSDGTWSFNKEDYDAGIGPTYYKKQNASAGCNGCGEYFDEALAHRCAGCIVTLCPDCVEKGYMYSCYNCNKEYCANCYRTDKMRHLCNGLWVCENCYDACNVVNCDYEGCNYYIDNSTNSEHLSGICASCKHAYCASHNELTLFTSGQCYCSACIGDAHRCSFCNSYVWTDSDDGFSYYCQGCNLYVCGNCDGEKHQSVTSLCGEHYCDEMKDQLDHCECGNCICISHMNVTSPYAAYCSNCHKYYCRDCYPQNGLCSCGNPLPSFATACVNEKPLFYLFYQSTNVALIESVFTGES